MKEQWARITLRLPSRLREKAKLLAEQNRRSMNNELVSWLEAHRTPDQPEAAAGIASQA